MNILLKTTALTLIFSGSFLFGKAQLPPNEKIQKTEVNTFKLQITGFGSSAVKGDAEAMEDMLNEHTALQLQSISTDTNGDYIIKYKGIDEIQSRIVYLIRQFGCTVVIL